MTTIAGYDPKSIGQFFTPRHIADFMVSLSTTDKSEHVIEPSCGDGVFLDALEGAGYENVLGYEIDPSLTIDTRYKVCRQSFVGADVSEPPRLVIGNPPYVRWKNLDAQLKAELKHSVLWRENCTSLSDYLSIFILKAIDVLDDGGELIYITPDYWTKTTHSKGLRAFMLRHGYFADVFHFGETPIFERVTSSIFVFRYIKDQKRRPSGRCVKSEAKRTPTTDQLAEMRQLRDARQSAHRFDFDQFQTDSPWSFTPKSISRMLDAFEKLCTRSESSDRLIPEESVSTLGDFSTIANGMVSGLDKAFRVPGEQCSKMNKLEKDATIDVLKGRDTGRFAHGPLTTYFFLNERVSTEEQLKRKYPLFYTILQPFRDKLAARYSYGTDLPYWHWAFPRSLNLFRSPQSRIFIPCKERISHKNYFRFCLADASVFPTQDVTCIVVNEDLADPHFLLAVLNHPIVFNWIKNRGVVKGNVAEFCEAPLARIPIPSIDYQSEKYAAIVRMSGELAENYCRQRHDELNDILDSAMRIHSVNVGRKLLDPI